MIHQSLYTRDSVGNIRIWYIEQEENKYRVIAGLIDGQKVTSEWTVCYAKNIGKKNETSPTEQASAEIAAKYKKQLKTGYFTTITDVDNKAYIQPMLAKSYKDYADSICFKSNNWILQCKFNGMRCIATIDGLFSRTGERYLSVPHIHESLIWFFQKYPEAVLDGELFNNDLRQNLNTINSLVRKTKNITESDIEKSKSLVSYYLYDGFGFGGLDHKTPYIKRKIFIDDNIVTEYDYIEFVSSKEISCKEDLDEMYSIYIMNGQEGGILRNKNSNYEFKRSKNLLKIKPEDDSEAIITNIQEGNGNWSGTGKIISLDWNGIIFDATFKGDLEEGRNFLKNKDKWIGKKVTFLYNGLTGLGTPNFARVDIHNCLKD